jgi:hypothetical protein
MYETESVAHNYKQRTSLQNSKVMLLRVPTSFHNYINRNRFGYYDAQ